LFNIVNNFCGSFSTFLPIINLEIFDKERKQKQEICVKQKEKLERLIEDAKEFTNASVNYEKLITVKSEKNNEKEKVE
jgi:hypothetical protein